MADFFPDRTPINRYDFALRHILLETIKARLRAPNISAHVVKRLDFLADFLSVEHEKGSSEAMIKLNEAVVMTIPKSTFTFFKQPADILPCNDTEDPTLKSNLEEARRIIEKLEDMEDLYNQIPHATRSGLRVSCIIVFSNFFGNAEALLRDLLASLESQVSLEGWIDNFEIIVVNDGSPPHITTDLVEVRSVSDKIVYIANGSRLGIGSSFSYGLQHCRFDTILFVEASAHLNLRSFEKLLAEAKNFEVVLPFYQGFVPPFSRRVAVVGWRALTTILFGTLPKEVDSHVKLFSRGTLERIGYNYIRSRSHIFNTELLVRVKRAGIAMKQIPLHVNPEESHFQRSLSVGAVLQGLLSLLHLRYVLGVERLSWFGFVTGIFSRTTRPLEMLEFRRTDTFWDEKDTHDLCCPICGAEERYLRRTRLHETLDRQTENNTQAKHNHRVVLCLHCRNAFSFPLESQEVDTLPDESKALSTGQSWLLSYFMRMRVKRLLRALEPGVGPFQVLDVGGGAGLFATELVKLGHSVAVVDPHSEYKQLATGDAGLTFHQCRFEKGSVAQLGLTGRCDAVTFWHSLEHFNHPSEAIDEAMKALKPEGILYICVPNLNGLQAELFRQAWAYLDVPRHRYHFCLDGLLALLKSKPLERHCVYWWNAEYEIFGFFQSLLNIASSSHNYYYNLKKKGVRSYVPVPWRNRWVHRLSFIFLPIALVLSIIAPALGKPSCVEVHSHRRLDD